MSKKKKLKPFRYVFRYYDREYEFIDKPMRMKVSKRWIRFYGLKTGYLNFITTTDGLKNVEFLKLEKGKKYEKD